LRAAAWVACETETTMLSAIVLICSATLHDCTLDNATVVMRLRVESGSPAACLMHAQEVMAQTNQPRARRGRPCQDHVPATLRHPPGR
jgi:hypothetical protein